MVSHGDPCKSWAAREECTTAVHVRSSGVCETHVLGGGRVAQRLQDVRHGGPFLGVHLDAALDQVRHLRRAPGLVVSTPGVTIMHRVSLFDSNAASPQPHPLASCMINAHDAGPSAFVGRFDQEQEQESRTAAGHSFGTSSSRRLPRRGGSRVTSSQSSTPKLNTSTCVSGSAT